MSAIYRATNDVEIRTLSLEALLIAAVSRHRFAAMDVFNGLIKKIAEDEAMSVSEMLQNDWISTELLQIKYRKAICTIWFAWYDRKP